MVVMAMMMIIVMVQVVLILSFYIVSTILFNGAVIDLNVSSSIDSRSTIPALIALYFFVLLW